MGRSSPRTHIYARRATIVDAARELDPAQALDLGCGSGATTRDLHGAWPEAHIVGVDPKVEAVEVAAARSTTELDWLCAGAAQLPFPDSSFDLVVAQQVIQFIADYAPAVREVRRILSPNGAFVVLSWSAGGNPVLAALDRILMDAGLRQSPPCRPAQSFDRLRLLRAADASGLQLVREAKPSIPWTEPDLRRFVACFIPDATDAGRAARRAALKALTAPMQLECDLLVFAGR